MPGMTKTFYRFLCTHSFLIGLFPFFIPVYLWNMGLSISQICFFIALTGLSFCFSLFVWDRLVQIISFKNIILISFMGEVLLISTLFLEQNEGMLVLLGLLNGAYNCFFWTTNRLLFTQTITQNSSGRRFGNSQLIVTIFFKLGVLFGGYLLEQIGFNAVFIVSAIIGIFGIVLFSTQKNLLSPISSSEGSQAIKLSEILSYKDQYHSKLVFAIDGLFLYLESYFWIISLFQIVQQSFWKLGLLVIVMVVIFSLIYILIKNVIDRISVHHLYNFGVLLYLLSWLLRSKVDQNLNLFSVFILLIFITFFTSLFRLTFNKRFFDITKSDVSLKYILIKSYYSQFYLAVFFGVLGGISYLFSDSKLFFRSVYWIAALLTLVYLFYQPVKIKIASKPLK